MNTFDNNSSQPGRGAGVHRGIWIGGGLMALTIVALATTLVVKGNSADSQAPAPLADASATAPATAGSAAMDANTVATTTQPAVVPAPIPVVSPHHTPGHHDERVANGNDAAAPGGPSYASDPNAPQQVASVPVCATCGVIDSYSTVQVKGQNNGVGAVAGGVGGALIGSKIAGRGNHTLGGLIGAVGGGLLGNAVETHERTTTAYEVRVRMSDGSIRTVRQASVPHVGARVRVDGNVLHPEPSQG